jgi:hypothetical protein
MSPTEAQLLLYNEVRGKSIEVEQKKLFKILDYFPLTIFHTVTFMTER